MCELCGFSLVFLSFLSLFLVVVILLVVMWMFLVVFLVVLVVRDCWVFFSCLVCLVSFCSSVILFVVMCVWMILVIFFFLLVLGDLRKCVVIVLGMCIFGLVKYFIIICVKLFSDMMVLYLCMNC